jgi:hypothetical protein
MDISSIDNFDSIKRWSYSLAKQYVRDNIVTQGVDSSRKFQDYVRKSNLPKHFPRRPDDYFRLRGSWKGWYDFLGTTKDTAIRRKDFYDYETAKKVTRDSGIKNSVEFRNWKNKPVKIPGRPELYYHEWTSWREFLGNNYYVPKPKHYCKLSEKDVRIIKQQLDMGVPGRYLAKHFKVSEMQISRIRNGENWGDI